MILLLLLLLSLLQSCCLLFSLGCFLIKTIENIFIEFLWNYRNSCESLRELDCLMFWQRFLFSLGSVQIIEVVFMMKPPSEGEESRRSVPLLIGNILSPFLCNYTRIISLMTPEDSWVARWQRIGKSVDLIIIIYTTLGKDSCGKTVVGDFCTDVSKAWKKSSSLSSVSATWCLSQVC